MARLAIVVEDDPSDEKEIADSLISSGFVVVWASDSTQAMDCLAGCPFPDLIILDWFCEGTRAGDGPSIQLVKRIVNSSFAPLAVITHDEIRAKENMPKEMPSAFCTFFAKFDLDTVMKAVDDWSRKPEFELARSVARAGTKAIGRVAWELARYEAAGVNSWLASVDDVGDFIEMLLRFVGRELRKEQELLSRLDNNIASLGEAREEVTQLLLRILSIDRYYVPPLWSPPMCGDVYRTSEDSYAILINPACDLVVRQQNKPKAVEAHLLIASTLSKLETETAKNGESADNRLKRFMSLLKNQDPTGTGRVRMYALPLLPVGTSDHYSELTDLFVHLDRVVIVSWEEFNRTYSPSVRIARLDSPFVEALLRQYSLFSDRIGLRDVPDEVLKCRAREAVEKIGPKATSDKSQMLRLESTDN